MFIKFNFLCAQVSSSGYVYGFVDCMEVVVRVCIYIFIKLLLFVCQKLSKDALVGFISINLVAFFCSDLCAKKHKIWLIVRYSTE